MTAAMMRPTAAAASLRSRDGATPFRWMHTLIVAIATLAALAPFLGKAFHIDDPMYLWAAQHIRAHPLDFYGFDVNWQGSAMPMHEMMQNPPLASYFLALGSLLVGWSEIGLHALFLLPALGLSLGTYVLASRLCSRPLLAALAALLSPAFLVCASSIMSDVPMACLWVWAIIAWDAALRSGRAHFYLAAALLIAACGLTKYFGASLVPLLFAYALARRMRLGGWILWLALAVALLGGYEWWTQRLYGRGLILAALRYSSEGGAEIKHFDIASRFVVALAFVGGSTLAPLLFAHRLWRWRVLAPAALACAGLAIVLMDLSQWRSLQRPMTWLAWPQICVLAAGGVSALAAAVVDAWRRRDGDSILLALWVIGTAAFACALNWSVTGRTILPMAPALAILVVRRMEDRDAACAERDPVRGDASAAKWLAWWPLAPMAVIALGVLWSDFTFARGARDAAMEIAKAVPANATLWFQGHWGFQHYLQQRGGRPLDFRDEGIRLGEFVAVPVTNSNVQGLPAGSSAVRKWWEMQPLPWIATLSPRLGAGFHSSVYGPLPFAVGPVPPDRYILYAATSPILHKRPDVAK